MKRGRDSAPSAAEGMLAADSAAPVSPQSAHSSKRAKSSQACSACRKHKTRCEVLNADDVSCHRCRVLSTPCSFEDAARQSVHVPATSSSGVSAPSLVLPRNDQAQRNLSVPPDMRGHLSPSPDTSLLHGVQFAGRSVSQSSTDHDGAQGAHTLTANEYPTPSSVSPFMSSSVPPESSVEDVYVNKYEEIILMSQRPWSFLKLPYGFNALTAPMLTMQTLTRPNFGQSPEVDHDVRSSLLQILTQDQIAHLLSIFESQFNPWLNLQPHQGTSSAFVTVVQAAVASRHLDPATRTIITPKLFELADEILFKGLFDPLPSNDTVHAMLILSLWGPLDLPSFEQRDSVLIAASAVSMAMNNRMNDAASHVALLRREKATGQDGYSAGIADAMNDTRLWLSLANAEEMLCIGTGRRPTFRTVGVDSTIIDTHTTATISACRDKRLALMARIYEVTAQGLGHRLESLEVIEKYNRNIFNVLMKMDALERLIAPLAVISIQECFHFHMLKIFYQSCRHLILLRALVELRKLACKQSKNMPWFLVVQESGVNVAASWCQELLLVSENILISVFSHADAGLLSAAPDIVFVMITFAAVYLVVAKFPQGSSDNSLLDITIDRLERIACSADHMPARCVKLLRSLVLCWERRISEGGNPGSVCPGRGLSIYDTGPCRPPRTPQDVHLSPALAYSASAERGQIGDDRGFSLLPTRSDQSHEGKRVPYMPQCQFPESGLGPEAIEDLNRFMNGDIFVDSDLWASFLNNLSNDTT